MPLHLPPADQDHDEGQPMMCDRCGKPIGRGVPTETFPKDSSSGPGGTVTVHAKLCKKPPTQTYPPNRSHW